MDDRIPTSEKLARLLELAKAPDVMISKARSGAYDDYLSDSATPIVDLVQDCRKYALYDIAERAMRGDFDAQDWEADNWAKSPEGKATFKKFIKS